ncbi:(2Fe-2S)-binding protein [Actinoplanes sp. GCM10030250]|uniref:(2Fe-2S)-binding protein n=1 Tax=Actinoplanes sp. GCM10030250 TaxID=3273376 RepID=UPI0036199DE1
MPDDDAAASALRSAARLGPYFTWEPYDDGPGWRPLRTLLDPTVIAERVGAGRRTLARMGGLAPRDIEERAAASIIFLGLASRLLSPVLGAVAVGGALPIPDRERMWWRPVEGGPMPIAARGLTAQQTRVGAAPTLARTAIQGLVEPVLDVFRERFALSPQVLWGNVASALGGAAGMIADAAPSCAERAASVVEAVLDLEPLRGTARLIRPDPAKARWFLVRNNCCLYYRIPGGGTCGDCVLTPEPARLRTWAAALRSGE